jgi:lipopolysaccharide transport system permease protein
MDVYEPNKYLKLGLRTWPLMAGELWHARELVWRLFVRNFSVRYKQSLLGYCWAVILPLIAIGTFILLRKAGIVTMGPVAAPYAVFALAGLSVYQLFSSGLSSGCGSLVDAGDMIAKVNFPREVLVLASAASVVFEFGVKLVLIALACAVFHFFPSPAGALLFCAAVVPLIFLTMGCMFFFSLANAVFRDTAQIVSIGSTFLMLLTPVLYPVPERWSLVFALNPLTALIDGPRDLLISGTMRDPTAYGVSAALGVLIFLAGWRVFHLVETKIPERL